MSDYRGEPLSVEFSRNPASGWGDVDTLFGSEFYTLDGDKFVRGGAIVCEPSRLPALFNNTAVMGDLIPATSWGASLANLLTRTSWDSLRHPLIIKNNNVCQLCGTRHQSLDVHELWQYIFPAEDDIDTFFASDQEMALFGTQKLTGLIAICEKCHECFHLGHANTKGRLEIVTDRLAAFNGWNGNEISDYVDTLNERFSFASKFRWLLDFSGIDHPEGGLTVKTSWNVSEEDDRILTADSRYGSMNVTGIKGIKWKLFKESNWREWRET